MANGFDIATLRLDIDGAPARQATTDLNRLALAGTNLERSTSPALAQLKRNLEATQRQVREWQIAARMGRVGLDEMSGAVAALRARSEGYRSTLVEVARRQQMLAASSEAATVAAERQERVFNRLRGPMTSVASQVVGLSGSFGSLTGVMLSLAGGSVVTVGVMATVAAVGALLKSTNEDAEKTVQLMKDVRAEMERTSGQAIQNQIALLKARQMGLQGELATGQPASEWEKWKRLLTVDRRNPDGSLIFKTVALSTGERAEIQRQIEELERMQQFLGTSLTEMFAIQKAPAIDWVEGVTAAIRDMDFAIKDVLNNGARLGRNLGGLPNFGSGASAAEQAAMINAANSMSPILRGTEGAARASREIAENWQSATASVSNAVTLLANGDDVLSRWLATTVTIVAQVEDLNKKLSVPGGKLGATDIVGLAATGLSVIAGLGGETAAQRRSRETMERNSERLAELKRSLDSSTLGFTGSAYTAARGGVGALLNDPSGLLRGLGNVNLDAVKGILAGAGTTYADLKKFAEQIGITLDTNNIVTFIESLKKMREAINATALVTLRTYSGQLDLVNRINALTGAGPVDQLKSLLGLVHNKASGNARLDRNLGAFDFTGGADRSAGLQWILAELERARNGQIKTEDLGNMSLQEYLNYLSQFGDLLNQANAQIKATVDTLRTFGKSLDLDRQLSILTPAQQLAEARKRYEDVVSAARGGDQAAAARLPEVARQFLELSRAYNASSPAYIADYQRVQRETEEIAKYYEGMQTTADATKKAAETTAANTTRMIEEQRATMEVLRAGVNRLADKLDIIGAKVDDSSTNTRLALQAQKGR